MFAWAECTNKQKSTNGSAELHFWWGFELCRGTLHFLKIILLLESIKDVRQNSIVLQEDFGGRGNIYTVHPDGHGPLRFYGNQIVNGKKRGKDREEKGIILVNKFNFGKFY